MAPAAEKAPEDTVQYVPPANRQWLRVLLPALPLVLLVLRLWELSRQDLQTMLLLIQYVNPVGLITALVVALIWVLPAVILTVRTLSVVLLVSDPDSGSRLARESDRMPGWVVVVAVLLAAFTWQLRFLPTLLMSVLMIVCLDARRRYTRHSAMWHAHCLGLPIAVAILCYIWLAPGIAMAFVIGSAAEDMNGLLLLLPPALAVLLSGPVPLWAARAVTRGTAIGAAVLAPILFVVIFTRAPILPTVAMEVEGEETCRLLDHYVSHRSVCVLLGQVITVDDRMVTLLRLDGSVAFVPNAAQRSRVLCATDEETPTSRVDVRGWPVESRVLDWIIPPSRRTELDPRCEGRPLPPEPADPRQGPDAPAPSDGAPSNRD